jgi:hypothetical protein
MKPEQLINNIESEINSLVELYSQGTAGQTALGKELEQLNLDEDQRGAVVSLIKKALEESTYNLICGLEGSASLGASQENYKLIDENGNELTGNLDTLFYEQIME